MLNARVVTLAAGVTAAILYALCVLFGLFVWTGQHDLLFEAIYPGFTWLTPGSFLLGLAESLLYGLLAGLVYGLVHNAVARRWTGARVAA